MESNIENHDCEFLIFNFQFGIEIQMDENHTDRRLLQAVVYERFHYKALTENIFGVLVFSSSSIVVTYIPCEKTWKESAQSQ